MFVPCLSGISLVASAEASEHVYMIMTNPGEDMNTSMNIGWHADYTYTGCTVEYTTSGDTSFSKAVTVEGTYDDDDYLWFEGRFLKGSGQGKFQGQFLNYGASLTGLTPDTDYIYRICDGQGGYSDTYAFRTGGQDEFSIMWLSDMHLSDNASKATKYQATLDYVQNLAKYDIGLYFNTGDVVSCGDRYGYWQEYIGNDVMKKYTYAATCGNHDLYDSMMKDDPKYTDFWKSTEYFRIVSNYPKNGYDYTSGRITTYLENNGYTQYTSEPADKLFTVEGGKLDGKKITGAADSTNGRAYWFIYNRILFIVFDYFAMTYNSEATIAFKWANEVVEQNKGKYDYLIATEHENLINGDSGTSRYYDKYKDFLDTANVDLFIAGDNHIFFRSYSLVNGAENTDPEKGTYVVQAPAITNTSSYPHYEGAVGYGVSRYADADYLGGIMIDVDSEGLHFTTAIASGDGSDYHVYETFDIPKKIRYADKEIGYYVLENDTDIYETTDLSSTKLATIPKGKAIEVFNTNGIWCQIRYDGFSGWTRLTSEQCKFVPLAPSTYPSVALHSYNQGFSENGVWAYDKGYTKGNGTIANGGWLFSGNYIYTAIEQEDGSYLITEVNNDGEPKKDTPLIDNGILLMCEGTNAATEVLKVGYRFTFDWANLALNEANPGEENPEIIIPEVAVGDVDADGKVDNHDATLILQYDVGFTNRITNGDYNGDGETDNLDAALILRADAGLES